MSEGEHCAVRTTCFQRDRGIGGPGRHVFSTDVTSSAELQCPENWLKFKVTEIPAKTPIASIAVPDLTFNPADSPIGQEFIRASWGRIQIGQIGHEIQIRDIKRRAFQDF